MLKRLLAKLTLRAKVSSCIFDPSCKSVSSYKLDFYGSPLPILNSLVWSLDSKVKKSGTLVTVN